MILGGAGSAYLSTLARICPNKLMIHSTGFWPTLILKAGSSSVPRTISSVSGLMTTIWWVNIGLFYFNTLWTFRTILIHSLLSTSVSCLLLRSIKRLKIRWILPRSHHTLMSPQLLKLWLSAQIKTCGHILYRSKQTPTTLPLLFLWASMKHFSPLIELSKQSNLSKQFNSRPKRLSRLPSQMKKAQELLTHLKWVSLATRRKHWDKVTSNLPAPASLSNTLKPK